MLFSFLRFCKEVITVSFFQLVTVFAKNRPSRPSVFLRVPPCPTRMRFATRGPTCNTKQWRHRISAIRSPSAVECACVFASRAHARMRVSGSSRVQRSIMYCKILKKKKKYTTIVASRHRYVLTKAFRTHDAVCVYNCNDAMHIILILILLLLLLLLLR